DQPDREAPQIVRPYVGAARYGSGVAHRLAVLEPTVGKSRADAAGPSLLARVLHHHLHLVQGPRRHHRRHGGAQNMDRILDSAPELVGGDPREVQILRSELMRGCDLCPLRQVVPALQQHPVRMVPQPRDPALHIGAPQPAALDRGSWELGGYPRSGWWSWGSGVG